MSEQREPWADGAFRCACYSVRDSPYSVATKYSRQEESNPMAHPFTAP